jgi:streptogramin lyase
MRLNPATRQLVRYANASPPGGPAPNAFFSNFGLKVDSKGRVLYTGSWTNYVGRLDPGKATVTEFLVPTPMAVPMGLTSDFWFTEALGNKIAVLTLPAEAGSKITGFTPAAEVESRPVRAQKWTIPGSTGKAPAQRFQLKQDDTVVIPQTGVTVGAVTGPFEEFPIPTPDSRPVDIAMAKKGVFFTEQFLPPPPGLGGPGVGGNKIGLLAP